MYEQLEPPERDPKIYTMDDFKEKYPFAYKMEKAIAASFQDDEVLVQDLLMLIRNLLARCRAVFTLEELGEWVVKLMGDAEYLLQTGQAFVNDKGEEINMVLAEEREVLGTNSIEVPDSVPEDWA